MNIATGTKWSGSKDQIDLKVLYSNITLSLLQINTELLLNQSLVKLYQYHGFKDIVDYIRIKMDI